MAVFHNEVTAEGIRFLFCEYVYQSREGASIRCFSAMHQT